MTCLSGSLLLWDIPFRTEVWEQLPMGADQVPTGGGAPRDPVFGLGGFSACVPSLAGAEKTD